MLILSAGSKDREAGSIFNPGTNVGIQMAGKT